MDYQKWWREKGVAGRGGGQMEIHKMIVRNYIETPGNLHELGYGKGFNLKWLRKKYTGDELKLSGNELIVTKNKIACCKLLVKDTVEFIQETETNAFDYLLSVAHLVHIPNEFDDILKTHIPRITKKYLFLYEHVPFQQGQTEATLKFDRNYEDFFGMELIRKREVKNKSYRIYILK